MQTVYAIQSTKSNCFAHLDFSNPHMKDGSLSWHPEQENATRFPTEADARHAMHQHGKAQFRVIQWYNDVPTVEAITVHVNEEEVRAAYDDAKEAELVRQEAARGVAEAQPANVPDGEEYVKYMGRLCAAAARAQEIAEFGFMPKSELHGDPQHPDLVGFEESRTWEWMWKKHTDEVMGEIQKVMYAEYVKLPF